MSERDVMGLKGKDFGKAIVSRKLQLEGRNKKRKSLEFESVDVLAEEIQDASKDTIQVLLHPFERKFKNFKGEHGRWRGERGKVVINLYDIPLSPDRAQEIIMQVFVNREHPCEITYEPDVLMGGKKQASKNPEGSHSLLWREDLSDSMIGWIISRMVLLDQKISEARR